MRAVKPIRTEAENEAALARIDELWNSAPGSPEADELEVLAILIEAFETKAYPTDHADPVDYLKYILESRNMKPQAIATLLGGSGRVSDILNRRRRMTLGHIRKLTEALDISADILVRPYELETKAVIAKARGAKPKPRSKTKKPAARAARKKRAARKPSPKLAAAGK